MSDTFLSPEELAAYNTRRNVANTAANRSLAYLTYQRQQAEQNYGQERNRVQTAWNQNWYNQQGGFGRRGLFNSGIFRGAGTNWQQQSDNALADQRRAYDQLLGGLGQQELNVEATRNSALSGVDAEQQARQALMAARIRGAQN